MEEIKTTSFSSYARKTILEALVYRCIDVCDKGSVEDILKLVPYTLNVTRDSDFEVTIDTPMNLGGISEFGEAVRAMVNAASRHGETLL